MDWNNIRPEERIHLWKNFRKALTDLPFEQQLSEITKFCAQMPIGVRTLDFYDPDSWPTPWEILYNGAWCTNSISLFIFYTLELLPEFSNLSLELLLIDDRTDRYLVVLVDNQFILNYSSGTVSMLQDMLSNFRIMERHSKDTIKKIK